MHSIILVFVGIIVTSSAFELGIPPNYTWPHNTKNFCFAARFDLVLNVDYVHTNGAKATASIPLNNDTYESYSASCSAPNNVHTLILSMLGGFTNIVFQFSVNSSNMTSLTKVEVYLTLNDKQTYFTNYSSDLNGTHMFSTNQTLFVSERGSSYRCNTKTDVTGFQVTRNINVTSVSLENLLVEPFADDSMEFTDYSVAKVCAADIAKNSNLIPIIVGACLAVMVIIVLVAYLIGRRRSRNGYQSV